jgi:nucleotide-binding universal stress UspA family protein
MMNKHLYLVGIDGSEWSLRAAERAINLAKRADARVKLVYVLDWQPVQPMVVEGIVLPPFDVKKEESYAQKNVISPLIEKYNHLSVELNGELIWGDPVDVLLAQVQEQHANMLFVGRRGRSRFADLLLGSVSNKLAHCIGIPIVLVP